jgi:lysyl-tRNA synthetase, class II
LFDNIYVQQRIEKANHLKEVGVNPYSNESKRNTTIKKFLNVNSDIEHLENKRDENRIYIVAGRIKLF